MLENWRFYRRNFKRSPFISNQPKCFFDTRQQNSTSLQDTVDIQNDAKCALKFVYKIILFEFPKTVFFRKLQLFGFMFQKVHKIEIQWFVDSSLLRYLKEKLNILKTNTINCYRISAIGEVSRCEFGWCGNEPPKKLRHLSVVVLSVSMH